MSTYCVKAKRLDNNEWECGYVWVGNDHAFIMPSHLGIDFNGRTLTANAVEIDKSTICRNTEIIAHWWEEDKKGDGEHRVAEIFENDILEVEYEDRIITGTVKYSVGNYLLASDELNDGYVMLMDLFDDDFSSNIIYAKIISNAYDAVDV